MRALDQDWSFWARDKQVPPAGDWFCWLLRSGRGFGKTIVGANAVIKRAQEQPYYPIALVGETVADVRDTMIEIGDSGIIKQSPPDFVPHYEPSKRRLTWPNGAIAITYSGDRPDQLRGPEHGFAWLDELAKFRYPQDVWDNLELGLRLGDRPQVVVTTTPRPIPIIRQLLDDPTVVDVVGSTYENLPNLSPRFRERLLRRFEGTRLGRQELYGELLEDVPGALWTRDMLETVRVKDAPQLKRVVVAIDPAVTFTEMSNETGIIAAGVGLDNHGYILADGSGQYSPDGWARKAIGLYDVHHADRMIGEVNNGGDLVERNIRTVDGTVSYRAVRASRGKYTRAEPVAALYEQGKVHHVGLFPELEDQLCTWVPGEASPDRLDALVWALTELMLKRGEPHKAEAKRWA